MGVMRAALLIGFVLSLGAINAFAQAPLIGERDTARPGGIYTQLRTSDAGACALLCDQDGLCLAWTYRETDAACELKAVVPQAIAEAGATSGLSARAPDFTRRVAPEETPAIRLTTAPEPIEPIAEHLFALADVPELLGGPLEADEPPPNRVGEDGLRR